MSQTLTIINVIVVNLFALKLKRELIQSDLKLCPQYHKEKKPILLQSFRIFGDGGGEDYFLIKTAANEQCSFREITKKRIQ